MALIKSHIASSIAGSIGGITYFHTRYGAIVARTRTIPTDPASGPQSTARAIFSDAVSMWKTLTQEQRDLWEAFAAGTPTKNKLGDTVYLTGQAWYIGIYSASISSGVCEDPGELDDCPCEPGVFPEPTVEIIDCEVEQCGGVLEITNNADTLSAKFVVWLSDAQSAAVKYFKGPWNYDLKTLTDATSAGASVEVPFCDLCEGLRYFYMVRAIASDPPYNISRLIYGSFLSKCMTV
jgi:hypothetical protein